MPGDMKACFLYTAHTITDSEVFVDVKLARDKWQGVDGEERRNKNCNPPYHCVDPLLLLILLVQLLHTHIDC